MDHLQLTLDDFPDDLSLGLKEYISYAFPNSSIEIHYNPSQIAQNLPQANTKLTLTEVIPPSTQEIMNEANINKSMIVISDYYIGDMFKRKKGFCVFNKLWPWWGGKAFKGHYTYLRYSLLKRELHVVNSFLAISDDPMEFEKEDGLYIDMFTEYNILRKRLNHTEQNPKYGDNYLVEQYNWLVKSGNEGDENYIIENDYSDITKIPYVARMLFVSILASEMDDTVNKLNGIYDVHNEAHLKNLKTIFREQNERAIQIIKNKVIKLTGAKELYNSDELEY